MLENLKCEYCEMIFSDRDYLRKNSIVCLARNTFENVREIKDSFDPPI